MGCESRNLVAINFYDSIARMNASTELSRAIGNEISNNKTTVGLGAEHDAHTALATDARREPLSRWILADAARELRLASPALP